MPLWTSYRALSMRTRLLIGGGIMAYATFGLLVSDKAEEALGLVPTEEDKQRLREAVPKIQTVERSGREGFRDGSRYPRRMYVPLES
ncbi:hypothetical protein B0A55_08779 [Friedmanniomyces simplex]|uniref:Uncharacterized protein n=1 Tax=Friedmanniomyces simplex TaxID=329884 RepID=A0A4U0WUC5_9PEZI|nr:hypothetical protein B0A55_08779 [Friedmanniomyces simplex]